ncbi:hypothetical protein BsIDN1_45100 [Bacillus safensis]|uniref:Uncharacterized protein n=1 Tax=Bacillus safensis TaxID=561879 RepID=A0A5S9ME64_BACIA|nr:hypothetical protein BsIDN1_45100 [Bacillus safensis]
MRRRKKKSSVLITLISLSEEDDLDIEEVKTQIVELQKKQNHLMIQRDTIEKEIKEAEGSVAGEKNAMKRALDYLSSVNADNLKLEDKKAIINFIVEEVLIVDSETIHIRTH